MSQVKEDDVVGMTPAKPEEQHRWLEQLVGDWTFETDMPGHEGQPATRAVGTETVRSIGGLWIQLEGHSDVPGSGPAVSLMTLGYDTATKRFVGSWIGSMMTHHWVYDGELDAAKRVLTLDSEGPSMAGDGSIGKYRDIITLVSPDVRTLTGNMLSPEGTWTEFMKMEYRRTK